MTDSVLIQENMGQRKPVFWHNLHSNSSLNLVPLCKLLKPFDLKKKACNALFSWKMLSQKCFSLSYAHFCGINQTAFLAEVFFKYICEINFDLKVVYFVEFFWKLFA